MSETVPHSRRLVRDSQYQRAEVEMRHKYGTIADWPLPIFCRDCCPLEISVSDSAKPQF